jgi:streptomycin 6-kinase
MPDWVRLKARARGTEGTRWLAGLGHLVGQLEHEWGVSVGSTLHGGTDSYVAAATTRDGTEAVVKIAIPGDPLFANEVQTLRAAAGRGYARLLASDEPRQALLLERLGPSLAEFGLSIQAQIEVLCAMLAVAWRVPAPPGLESGADKARRLATFISVTWEELNRPCSERVVERALAFAEARGAAFDPDCAVLVHGDAQSPNALQERASSSIEKGFRFVDPDGLFAERAYDLAIPMREWSRPLLDGDAARLGRERCVYLGRLTGVDTRAIWEWGFVERVSTGLLAMRVGAESVAREILDVAEAWAQA